MPNCSSVDPLITPYVDDELARVEREAVDAHVQRCPSCRARVAVERTVRDLIRAKRPAIDSGGCASAVLRASISRACHGGVRRSAFVWMRRAGVMAAAAALTIAAGGTVVYVATERSSQVMAAELTADHIKCFALNRVLGSHEGAASVETEMQTAFGWSMHVPVEFARAGLDLIGSRPCLYGEGRVAHIMCRHNGQPVSIFMLPQSARADALLDVMGHEAKIWSAGGRTFVLIANEPRPDVERMASVVQAALR
jgi:anti-sigma factor RsiW